MATHSLSPVTCELNSYSAGAHKAIFSTTVGPTNRRGALPELATTNAITRAFDREGVALPFELPR